jgi:hypothetical protein
MHVCYWDTDISHAKLMGCVKMSSNSELPASPDAPELICTLVHPHYTQRKAALTELVRESSGGAWGGTLTDSRPGSGILPSSAISSKMSRDHCTLRNSMTPELIPARCNGQLGAWLKNTRQNLHCRHSCQSGYQNRFLFFVQDLVRAQPAKLRTV